MFKTKADLLVELLEAKKEVSVQELTSLLETSQEVILAHAQYLEEAGIVSIEFKPKPYIKFLQSPQIGIEFKDKNELINRIKILLEVNNLKEVNRLLSELYFLSKKTKDEMLIVMYKKAHDFFIDYLKKVKILKGTSQTKEISNLIIEKDQYNISLHNFVMHVKIIKQEFELVPYYMLSLVEYGSATEIVLEKLKDEVIRTISKKTLTQEKNEEAKIRAEFKNKLYEKLKFLMPELAESNIVALNEYITLTALGMGEIEVLLRDPQLEEIVINSSNEPVWVYHRKYSWLKTNIIPKSEDLIKHYATIAGRIVNKDITLLKPLLDAHLKTGDRLNATLEPVSTKGHTITIRKFSSTPWTITSLIKSGTIDYDTAALVWLAIQYELSLLIVGGTGSGKTSTLNVISNFFPPNQRIISIEDTRELVLPDTLHWVPMQSRSPNPEGQGGISMLDLVVNSLRMRPDRIIVGEIRRKEEAEVLFEAMHTGHSVYATLHANSVSEAIMRLTNPPIDLPKSVLNALSLIIVQNRNRRTGERRTFQVAEILENSDLNLLFERDVAKDTMKKVNSPKRILEVLQQFSGLTKQQIEADITEKKKILKHLADHRMEDVHEIGAIVSDYYSNKEFLLRRLFTLKQPTAQAVANSQNSQIPKPGITGFGK